jgi:hypothetical protein
MAVPVDLLGPADVEDLARWPVETPPAVRAYLTPLVRSGPAPFLLNAGDTDCRVLVAGNRVAVPVIVTSGKPAAGSVAAMLSPCVQHIHYPLEELADQSRISRIGRRHARRLLGSLFKLGQLDRVVFLNHWLIPAAPCLPLSQAELAAATALLTRVFPNHALVVPYVVPHLGRRDDQALIGQGFHLIRSRIVFLVDPCDPLVMRRSEVKRAHRLLAAADERRVGGTAGVLARLWEVARLYHQHAIGKHSVYNPDYTEEFFRLALVSGLFEAEGWTCEEGRLVTFSMLLTEEGAVVASFASCDPALPRKLGLLRLASAWNLERARMLRRPINWGGGNATFKLLRGGRAAVGFEAVFDRHLPPHRRLPWRMLRILKIANERAGGVEMPGHPQSAAAR